jgi:hypothetical protein
MIEMVEELVMYHGDRLEARLRQEPARKVRSCSTAHAAHAVLCTGVEPLLASGRCSHRRHALPPLSLRQSLVPPCVPVSLALVPENEGHVVVGRECLPREGRLAARGQHGGCGAPGHQRRRRHDTVVWPTTTVGPNETTLSRLATPNGTLSCGERPPSHPRVWMCVDVTWCRHCCCCCCLLARRCRWRATALPSTTRRCGRCETPPLAAALSAP